MAVHILVSGVVQGVFYRKSTKSMADKWHIKGWVKNLPSGQVAIHAEGNEHHIKSLIAWCQQGPANALVTEVLVKETIKLNCDEFTILI